MAEKTETKKVGSGEEEREKEKEKGRERRRETSLVPIPSTLGPLMPVGPPAQQHAWSSLLEPKRLTDWGEEFTIVAAPIIEQIEIKLGAKTLRNFKWCRDCKILHSEFDSCATHHVNKELFLLPPPP